MFKFLPGDVVQVAAGVFRGSAARVLENKEGGRVLVSMYQYAADFKAEFLERDLIEFLGGCL